jgi:hypothetical protein
MAELRLEFHPMEDGTILCRRFRANGEEARSVTYRKGDSIMGLTPEQEAEYKLAQEMI